MRLTAVLLGLVWVYGGCRSSTLSEVKELKGIVGDVVYLPAAVKKNGLFFKNGSQIGSVIRYMARMATPDRVQWDRSTGLVSIHLLEELDSGEYVVQNMDTREVLVSIYQLSVYNPVPRPQVSSRSRVKPSCSVLCSVENGRELTLSWHREGRILSYNSSPNLSTPLSLPLEIEENSAPYSCVAENPARQEIFLVKPEEPSTQTSGVQQEQGETQLQCAVLCGEWERAHPVLAQRGADTVQHQQPQSQHPLSLPLEIEENSAPYSCVAENPARKEIVLVKPEEYCYDPVSRPQVSSRSRVKPSCSVLCSVENGRELTLSWHREGQILSYTSSPNLSTPLSLPLEIEENSAPYSCVTANPVSNETVTVRPEDHCFDRDTRSLLVAATEAFIGILFIVLMGTYICFMIRSNTLGS
ncbi:hypothetical protein COCON_G00100880 [Conger conger]|uniref:Ig-like domain-containing protein n=1 Tax=Conger conger TaxID=82655 RepID=A0A9Q1HZ06_CONCO|nr:hypothetical protein COCON_G00100880 [Conger conger]